MSGMVSGTTAYSSFLNTNLCIGESGRLLKTLTRGITLVKFRSKIIS